MTYGLEECVIVALIMTFGSIVQGAVGFASGLIGVPLLVLCNFSLSEAATINLVSTSVQNITGAWKLWPHLDPSELVLPVAVRWLAIPVGAYMALVADERLNPAQSKQLIGVFLIVVVCLLLGFKIRPRDYLHVGWKLLAFSTSGFLMGFAAIGGAPMVLYVNSLTWTAQKSRAFLFFCSAAALPVALAAFWFEHGSKVLPAVGVTMTVMPLILMGLWVGLHAGGSMSKPLFRRLTFGLLFTIACFSIASPYL
ncbi:MAG: sulfite exporter TauE/SafE family protein [Planctomycetota bacterium]